MTLNSNRPYDPSRPLILFDQTGATEPSDPFAVLEKARDTSERYFTRLAYEEWEATDEGLAAILCDPEFTKRIEGYAALRDRELLRENDLHARAMESVEREHRERLARMRDRHVKNLTAAHEKFESAQRGAMGFHGRRAFEARRSV